MKTHVPPGHEDVMEAIAATMGALEVEEKAVVTERLPEPGPPSAAICDMLVGAIPSGLFPEMGATLADDHANLA